MNVVCMQQRVTNIVTVLLCFLANITSASQPVNLHHSRLFVIIVVVLLLISNMFDGNCTLSNVMIELSLS